MKSGRQNVILRIIEEQSIENQKQLQDALEERGIKSTQATLSRDIKDLHLVKELSPNGIYRYVRNRADINSDIDERLRTILNKSVTGFDFAQNLFVIKTMPGLASAACSALESMDIENMVGTVAGDDTAFIAMRTASDAEKLYYRFREITL